MKRSIRFKLLLLIFAGFFLSSAGVVVIVGHYQKKMIDRQQSELYAEKLDAIFNGLVKSHNDLVRSGMIELYETEAKQTILEDLRARYDTEKNTAIYPFIATGEGAFVLHPTLTADDNIKDFGFGQAVLTRKNGELDYTFEASKKWMKFVYFQEWKWIVGYTVPHAVKYAAAYQMRNTLIAALAAFTLLALVVLSCAPLLMAPECGVDIEQGQAGEPCTRTDDCAEPLRCLAGSCQRADDASTDAGTDSGAATDSDAGTDSGTATDAG